MPSTLYALCECQLCCYFYHKTLPQIAGKKIQALTKIQCSYYGVITRYTVITDQEIAKSAKRMWMIREYLGGG